MSEVTVSSWASTYISHLSSRTPEEKLEITQSIHLIASVLQGTISAPEAASQIAAIFKPGMNTAHSTNFKALWGIIAGATRTFSGVENESLVDLYFAIKELPEVTNKYGYVFKVGGKHPWSEMPDWGWVYWEHGLDLDWQYDPYLAAENDEKEWFEQAPGKLNSTTFAATIVARAGTKTGMWRFASSAMDDALETPYDTSREKFVRDGVEILSDPIRELEGEWRIWVPPAVEWIMVAGERLYEFSFCGDLEENFKVQSKDWRWGARYFSKQRWEFWKERFRELIKWDEVDARCRDLMIQAVERMEAVESENGYVNVNETSLEGSIVFPDECSGCCNAHII